ncbi:thioesterase family protein [Burkholderia anthina]|uniref:thioesterase family protein n=1 Tax=Burkholderia anthina TaxID=179879 RepID=UPI001589F56F|nr:thioesterase [Burkholderia anthina]
MPAKRTTAPQAMGMPEPGERRYRDAQACDPDVLSMSALMGLVEAACVDAMCDRMRSDEWSIGRMTHVTHLAPTPSDVPVFATATFRTFDGERYWFDVVAADAAGPVASASHARSIVARSALAFQCASRRSCAGDTDSSC